MTWMATEVMSARRGMTHIYERTRVEKDERALMVGRRDIVTRDTGVAVRRIQLKAVSALRKDCTRQSDEKSGWGALCWPWCLNGHDVQSAYSVSACQPPRPPTADCCVGPCYESHNTVENLVRRTCITMGVVTSCQPWKE